MASALRTTFKVLFSNASWILVCAIMIPLRRDSPAGELHTLLHHAHKLKQIIDPRHLSTLFRQHVQDDHGSQIDPIIRQTILTFTEQDKAVIDLIRALQDLTIQHACPTGTSRSFLASQTYASSQSVIFATARSSTRAPFRNSVTPSFDCRRCQPQRWYPSFYSSLRTMPNISTHGNMLF